MSVTGLPKHGNSVKATFYFLINRHAKTNGHKYSLTDKNSVDLGVQFLSSGLTLREKPKMRVTNINLVTAC